MQEFHEYKTTVLHDFEMRPGSRRPKVLVQTAGHVSGAVYFYQKKDVQNSSWPDDKVPLIVPLPIYSCITAQFLDFIWGLLTPEVWRMVCLTSGHNLWSCSSPWNGVPPPQRYFRGNYVWISKSVKSCRSLHLSALEWWEEDRITAKVQRGLAILEFSGYDRTRRKILRSPAAILPDHS